MRESWFSEAAAPRWLLLGCLLGLLLRVGFFLPERALWLDEALTALNLAEREASGLLEPLDGDQAAPPAFLLASKLSGEAGQGSAHALRFRQDRGEVQPRRHLHEPRERLQIATHASAL